VTPGPVKVGIIGLGRWARVLTWAAKKSQKLEIITGFSRSEEKRVAFEQDTGIPSANTIEDLLANPEIVGVILTVPQ
jgi:predicted dehydrogenase